MHRLLSSSSKRLCRTLVGASIVAGLCTLHSAPADAHFMLSEPASWMSQGATGLPEKMGPCGNEGGGTATGTVTNYMGGDTVTITIDEIIFHPGHYRVALSTDGMNAFPDEPAVTVADTPCGSAAVESPVAFPVLADGLFTHTEAFATPQTAQITLPNMTCTNCTLQVIEFMGDHALNVPGGCFYHHCANITITATGNGGTSSSSTSGSTSAASSSSSASGSSASGVSSSASGVSSSASGASSVSSGGTTAAGAGGAGTGEGPSAPSGCKCSMPGEGAPASLGSLAVLAALLRRRRRG